MNLDDLTQLIVPGSADITFAKPGAHAVYYEYRSVVNGVKYETGKPPPSLECNLTSKKTGAKVYAVPDFVESNTYWSKEQERIGVLIMSITMDDPGIYTFACQYRDGIAQPEIVVSVGPNFIWEFFNIFAKVGGSILSAIAIFFYPSSHIWISVTLTGCLYYRASPPPRDARCKPHRPLPQQYIVPVNLSVPQNPMQVGIRTGFVFI